MPKALKLFIPAGLIAILVIPAGLSANTLAQVESRLQRDIFQKPLLKAGQQKSSKDPAAPNPVDPIRSRLRQNQQQPPVQVRDQAAGRQQLKKARQARQRAYQQKFQNLRECGPMPGAPGNWVCQKGKWQLLREDKPRPTTAQPPKAFLKRAEALRQLHREQLENRRTQFLQHAEKRRQERLEQLKQKREEFKQKIKARLDARKQEIAKRLADRLTTVNQRHTEIALRFLEKIETVLLEKIEARALNIEDEFGIDLSAVHQAVDNARAKINEAIAAVQNQAAKVYVVEIQENERVGQAIRRTVLNLREDLRQLRTNYLRPAKEAVRQAFQTLAGQVRNQQPSVKPAPATSSPNP